MPYGPPIVVRMVSSLLRDGANLVNILKTTPTPNKNGSYGIKVGVCMPEKSEFVCHKSRFVHHILCESPFISGDFNAIRPLILWHILGAYFLLIWGGAGVVKIVFAGASEEFRRIKSTPDPDTWQSIAIHLPFLSRYFGKSMPSSWQKVLHTPITFSEVFGSGVVGTLPKNVRNPNSHYRRKLRGVRERG